jgi:hypothetical protein
MNLAAKNKRDLPSAAFGNSLTLSSASSFNAAVCSKKKEICS